MIALRDSMPLIVLRNRRALSFSRDWFARALSYSALRAGHRDWCLAEHVAESVHQWLKSLNDRMVMTAAAFTRAVREALRAIGFAEIGACFEAAAPFARISLVEIAQQAGDGYELAFFQALDARLNEVFQAGGAYCELHGVGHCVRILRRRGHWSCNSDALREEIVTHARNRAASALSQKGCRVSELFLHVE